MPVGHESVQRPVRIGHRAERRVPRPRLYTVRLSERRGDLPAERYLRHGGLRGQPCRLQRNGQRRVRGGYESRPEQLRPLRLHVRDGRRDPLRDQPARRADPERSARLQRGIVRHRLLRPGVGRLQRCPLRRLRDAHRHERELRGVRNGLRPVADVYVFDAKRQDGLQLRLGGRIARVSRRQSAPRQTRESPDGDAAPGSTPSVNGAEGAAPAVGCGAGCSGRVRKRTTAVASCATPTASPTSATM